MRWKRPPCTPHWSACAWMPASTWCCSTCSQRPTQHADRPAIQEHTVKAHVTAIFEKLGVRNRTPATGVSKALELGEPARVL
jgi:hypothetical protein